MVFVKLLWATYSELNAIYNKKITVKELAKNITNITNYNKNSLF
ncbi:hypothetical protein BHWA1_00971 [Brachyspira hyodysenteriae WA1]|uniref:Uncharacterized protein n=1 Tax=Brachyspira hyodysenteriae (strain ATCC 49526 / WA1) TaxID=565034 RepID=A0A3B6VF22_BRAHW|nr:hypothetical protein BHWA1_00971 [Brachyspira hyodysenteriae WA1]